MALALQQMIQLVGLARNGVVVVAQVRKLTTVRMVVVHFMGRQVVGVVEELVGQKLEALVGHMDAMPEAGAVLVVHQQGRLEPLEQITQKAVVMAVVLVLMTSLVMVAPVRTVAIQERAVAVVVTDQLELVE